MNHAPLARLALGLSLPVAIAISGCGDSNNPAGLSAGGGSSGNGGQSGSSGGTSGQGNNGTRTPPTAADSFTLSVHVGSGPSITDADHSIPVAGAAVSIFKTEWTFITHGTGADTMSGREVQVGSAITDSEGNVRFEKLSQDLYRIQADGPADSGLESRWVRAELLRQANVSVPLILKKAP